MAARDVWERKLVFLERGNRASQGRGIVSHLSCVLPERVVPFGDTLDSGIRFPKEVSCVLGIGYFHCCGNHLFNGSRVHSNIADHVGIQDYSCVSSSATSEV